MEDFNNFEMQQKASKITQFFELFSSLPPVDQETVLLLVQGMALSDAAHRKKESNGLQ